MNTWQIVRQIKHLLQSRRWSAGASNDPVFGSVVISQGPEDRTMRTLRMPLALVRIGSNTADPEHSEMPDLIQQDIEAVVMCSIPSDTIGEAALIGANRTGGSTSSAGRGLLEIEEELFDAIGDLNDTTGARLRLVSSSAPDPELFEDTAYAVWRKYRFQGAVTMDRFYHPVTRFSVAAPGAGNATLTFTLPPNRWDKQAIVIRKASGSTAPATATDGTSVDASSITWSATTAMTSVSLTDPAPFSPPGTWSFSVFAAYDETGSDTNERFSAAASATKTLT